MPARERFKIAEYVLVVLVVPKSLTIAVTGSVQPTIRFLNAKVCLGVTSKIISARRVLVIADGKVSDDDRVYLRCLILSLMTHLAVKSVV